MRRMHLLSVAGMTRLSFAGVMLLSACLTTPFSLHAVNVDGPTVELVINGQLAATLPCGSSAVLEPGGTLPAMPWHIEVRTPAGVTLNNGRVNADQGPPMGLLVRGSSVLTGPYPMAYGPAPLTPCPS